MWNLADERAVVLRGESALPKRNNGAGGGHWPGGRAVASWKLGCGGMLRGQKEAEGDGVLPFPFPEKAAWPRNGAADYSRRQSSSQHSNGGGSAVVRHEGNAVTTRTRSVMELSQLACLQRSEAAV